MARVVLYTPYRTWNKDEVPEAPVVYLVVGDGYRSGDGEVFLSAELMTEAEIDEAVDYLKENLEECRTKAKEELRRGKDKIAAWRNERRNRS